jgi:hypothetical protein
MLESVKEPLDRSDIVRQDQALGERRIVYPVTNPGEPADALVRELRRIRGGK